MDGEYVPQETVLPSWAHNAMPWVTPDGDITIWHIGNGSEARPPKSGCTNGTTPLHPEQARGQGRTFAPAPISTIPFSANPAGPWKLMSISCETAAGQGPCPIDNPTPLSLTANGTTLLAHRARQGFSILVAPHWTGPYKNVAAGDSNLNTTNVHTPDDEYSCEDGFLFRGQQGEAGGIHLLCHCNGVKGYPWFDHGRHAYSLDGRQWHWSKERTFLPTFAHPDGSNTTHISRQRPQLVFGAGWVPTQLITGIAVASTNRPYAWQDNCNELDAVSKPCDLTCTSMQAILP